jgi:pyruvate dehydrogenase E1 component beta subunit
MQASGLKVVVPSTAADAKGLMLSAIRDPDPVVFLMDISLSAGRGPVPEGEHTVPIGTADVKREGSDVTVVAMASAVPEALKAAERLEADGTSVEVVDLRTLVPLDLATVLGSVRKTGRLVAVETGRRTCGLAGEIVALAVENAWDALREPPARVTWPDVPVPFSPGLEAACRVRERDIVAAVQRVVRGTSQAAMA